jgi:hypothetical protein
VRVIEAESARAAANGAHCGNVGVMHAVKQPDQQARGPAGENLMAGQAAGLALSANARADNKVVAARIDGTDDFREWRPGRRRRRRP